MSDWANTLPQRLHQRLYREAHKGIITHQHSLWLTRNAILHPQTDIPHCPSYGRKRKTTPTVDTDSDDQDDLTWKRTRLTALDTQAVWRTRPKYRPTVNRTRKLALLANPTALPRSKRRRVQRKRPRQPQDATHAVHIKRRRLTPNTTHTLEGGDGEGSSDPSSSVDSHHDQGGPSAPERGPQPQTTQITEGSLQDPRGSQPNRSIGTQGPPPSATGGG